MQECIKESCEENDWTLLEEELMSMGGGGASVFTGQKFTYMGSMMNLPN